MHPHWSRRPWDFLFINLFSFIGAVLSDQRKRTLYDAGFYDPDGEEDEVGILEMCLSFVSSDAFVVILISQGSDSLGIELCFQGFSDFVQEMVSLMDQTRREVYMNLICVLFYTQG